MRLIIDSVHTAESERGSWWRLFSSGNRIRSAVRRTMPKSITEGTLKTLALSLAWHRVIPVEQLQHTKAAHELIQRTADRLMTDLQSDPGASVVFDGRKFLVERGEGDWIGANPGKTIARVRHAKDFVGSWPSLASAMFAIVERRLHASDESMPYSRVDAAMLAIAETLVNGVEIVDRTKPVEPVFDLSNPVHIHIPFVPAAPLFA